MRILFYHSDFKVVGILREKDRSIAVVTYDKASKIFGDDILNSNLNSAVAISNIVTTATVDGYSYFFNLVDGKITVYRGEYGKSSSSTVSVVETPLGNIECILHRYEPNFNLDIDEEIQEDFTDTIEEKEFISDCEKCHGTGFYSLDGLEVACDCYKQLENKPNFTEKPLKIENATKDNCCSVGLVPLEYRDTEFNSDKVKQNLMYMGESLEDFRLVNIDRFMSAFDSILMACKTGSKLRHSYLLACDKGFGKLEFVYDCLKYLYKRHQTCCKFISLQELGALRSEYIKKSQAIINCGYYYKDNDRELMQRTIEDEGKQIIAALMKDWFEVSKLNSVDQNTIKKSLSLLENSLLEKIYARANIQESTVSLYEDTKSQLINTWEDYISYPLVFLYFSGSLDRHYETEVLQELLNIRGTKALPTICFIESSLGIFQDEPAYFDNGVGGTVIDIAKTRSYYWLNMLSSESNLSAKNIDSNAQDNEITNSIEYDRLVYINSYIDYKNRLKVEF